MNVEKYMSVENSILNPSLWIHPLVTYISYPSHTNFQNWSTMEDFHTKLTPIHDYLNCITFIMHQNDFLIIAKLSYRAMSR